MEDDPLGSGSVSGSREPAGAQSSMDALRRALEQGQTPTVSEVNSFLRLCETQEVSSETIAKVEELLGTLKKSGFRMKEVKAAYGALKAMEARKVAQKSGTGTSTVTPAKAAASTPATTPSTAYSSALGVNIPATRRPQAKDTKTAPALAGRPKTPKAAPGEATPNEAGFRRGDKVVFAPFCPHRDRGVGTVVFSSHSGIRVAFDSGGRKEEEWLHNEIVARPESAQGSANKKSTGGTSVRQKDEGQSVGWFGSAPAPAPAAQSAVDEDTL